MRIKRETPGEGSKRETPCATAFPRKMLPERISESVTPTSSLREIRRIRRLMRRGFRLPLLPLSRAVTSSPLTSFLAFAHSRRRERYSPWLSSLFHGIPRIDSINSFARAMRVLSSPYFPSFRCPPLPLLHRRFVCRRRSSASAR